MENVRIKYYMYNTFIIESGDKKIAIDPGADLYFFKFKTLIPKFEWKDITHIFVTHGDIDHHWYTDRVADVSNASVICNKTMIKDIEGKKLMLGPRDKGLAFTTLIKNLHTISVDETIQLDGISITGLKVTHGPVSFKLGPFSKTLHPGPDERAGYGSIGFKIQLNGKTFVNLADSILHEKEWEKIKGPDVLMLPIGGRIPRNTMDEKEALIAVRIIEPKIIIPVHYNCASFFQEKYNTADERMFKEEVEKMGFKCSIMNYGDLIIV